MKQVFTIDKNIMTVLNKSVDELYEDAHVREMDRIERLSSLDKKVIAEEERDIQLNYIKRGDK